MVPDYRRAHLVEMATDTLNLMLRHLRLYLGGGWSQEEDIAAGRGNNEASLLVTEEL